MKRKACLRCRTTALGLLFCHNSWPSVTSAAWSSSSSSTPRPSPVQRLRDLIKQQQQDQNRAIVLPGVHDALSASIFTQAGAPGLFLSGFGVSASHWSVPDAGILTSSEMEDAARRVINAVNNIQNDASPLVLVDGDTGYGGAANMRRAIRGFASAGAAAVSIEDQVFPKRCTYIAATSSKTAASSAAKPAGPKCVSREASLARVRTALAAAEEAYEQDGNEVWIIAGTDGRLALGFDEVVARCREYERLGAQIVYAENLQSPDEYQRLRDVVTVPMILAQVQLHDPKQQQTQQSQHLYSLEDISELGYNFGLFGVTALQASVAALQSVAEEILLDGPRLDGRRSGIIRDQHLSPFSKLKGVVGYPELEAFEQAYPCE